MCAALVVFAHTAPGAQKSGGIVVATGEAVPKDDHLPAEGDYRMPEEYRANAVQFRTEDGILLVGWVLGESTRGVTLAHANGWMVNSWLPFARRLVEAGYMVILWEFRNIEPSGFAPPPSWQRWDLDVLAAAQVLRERGATRILAMGASDGGNATAVASPHIPDLAGIALLSSPARSKGDGVKALGQLSPDIPAFFAVSTDDPGGRFYPEVEALYRGSAATHKEFHVLTSYEHGTDLLSDEDASSRMKGSTEAQKQERRRLAEDLMRFAGDSFAVFDAGDAAGTGGTGGTGSTGGTGDTAGGVASGIKTASGTADYNKPDAPEIPDTSGLSGRLSDLSGTPRRNLRLLVIGTVAVVMLAAAGVAAARNRRK